MAVRFHINPATGDPGACRAEQKCPFGIVDAAHRTDPAQVRVLYEQVMADYTLPKPIKKRRSAAPQR